MTRDLTDSLLLDRYRVLKPLPESGAGLRYLARDEQAAEPTPVVVETIIGIFDRETLEAFEGEVERLSAVEAPGVARLLEAGEGQDMRVLVHEYVHGYRLAHWHDLLKRREERFSVDTAVYLAASIAGALSDLHGAKEEGKEPVLHGELTPSSVLVRADGAVKLTDFRFTTPSAGQTAIGAAQAMTGKFSLLAPELVNRKDGGPQSDIYGAGLILYILLAGDHGLAGNNMFETLKRVMEHAPTPLAEVRDDVPAALSDLVARVLAKDPKDRPTDAGTFARELEEAAPPASKEDVVGKLMEDFRDLPQELGLPPLEELEQAWRGPASKRSAPAPAAPKRKPREVTASGAVETVSPASGTVETLSPASGTVETVSPASGTVETLSPASGTMETLSPASGAVETVSRAREPASSAPRLSRQQLLVGGLVAAAVIVAAILVLLGRG